MSLGSAFRDAYRTFVARPADVLPFYVAGLAVPAVTRTIPFVGILIAYLALARTGRLDQFWAVLEDAAPIALDDPQSPAGIDREAMEAALDQVFTPTILAILAASVLLSVVVVLVVDSAISAGQLHADYAALRDRRGLRPSVDGAFAHASTFVALVLLELLAWAVVFGAVAAVGVASPLLAVLVGLLGAFGLLVARLVFAFARPAAVVDGTGALAALRNAAGHVADRPLQSVGYGLLVLLFGIAVAVFGFFLSSAGANAGGSLVSLLAVRPLVDMVKTTLYADRSDAALSIPTPPERSTTARLREEFGRGWRELVGFTRGHLGLVGVSAAIFVASAWVGLQAGGAVDHVFEMSIERRLADLSPLGFFIGLAANNWSVSAAQSYAGLFFGIPTVVSLAFNGLNLGVVYQFEVAPDALVAFVVPHGLVELPSLVLSGALGLHLGVVGWNYATGDLDRAALTEAFERAYYVLLGLALLFVLAGAIEAFVSPYYWRILGLA